jgi:hypothetical protein
MIENIASDYPTATELTLNRYSRADIAQLIAPLRLKSLDRLFVTVTEQGESSLRYLPIYIKSNGFVSVCSDYRAMKYVTELSDRQDLIERFFANFAEQGCPSRLVKEQYKPSYLDGDEYLTTISYEWRSRKGFWMKASLNVQRNKTKFHLPALLDDF